MRIALAQLELSAEPQENLGAVKDVIVRAADAGADLVVFPEATMKAFNTGRLDTVAEPLDGPFATAVRSAAAEAGVTVVLGMFRPADVVERDGKELQRVHNTLLATGPDVDAHYDKIRLFDAFGFRESDTVAPGDELVVIDVPVGDAEVRRTVRVGLATCFDIRFPESARIPTLHGARILMNPGAFNMTTGPAHWELLLRQRAVDNQCFTVGTSPARDESASYVAWGNSMVCDPWGTVLHQCGTGEELVVTELELSRVSAIRRQLPILSARRTDIYEISEK